MIEGVRIDVKGDKLRGLIGDRAKFHAGCAAARQLEADKERKLQEEFEARRREQEKEREPGKAYAETTARTISPFGRLDDSAKRHGQRARFFEFVSLHLDENETYRLGPSEISTYELSFGVPLEIPGGEAGAVEALY